MSWRIGVITNRHAQTNRSRPSTLNALDELLDSKDVHITSESLEELDQKVAQLAADEIEVVAVNGGDGSIRAVLTRVLEHYPEHRLPTLALLRGGTMNTISNSFGIRGRPPGILKRMIERRNKSQPLRTTPRAPLRIDDGVRVQSGFIFGTGLVYNYLEEYYAQPKVSPLVAAKVLAHGAASAMVGGRFGKRLARTLDARLVVDGVDWLDDSFITIIASTTSQLGLGFAPLSRVTEDLSRFEALALSAPLRRVTRALPRLRKGQLPGEVGFANTTTTRMTIQSEAEIEYDIDGDLFTTQEELEIRIGPLMEIVI